MYTTNDIQKRITSHNERRNKLGLQLAACIAIQAMTHNKGKVSNAMLESVGIKKGGFVQNARNLVKILSLTDPQNVAVPTLNPDLTGTLPQAEANMVDYVQSIVSENKVTGERLGEVLKRVARDEGPVTKTEPEKASEPEPVQETEPVQATETDLVTDVINGLEALQGQPIDETALATIQALVQALADTQAVAQAA